MSPRDILGMRVYTFEEFNEVYPLKNGQKNGSKPFGPDSQTIPSESGPNRILPFFTVGALKERAASEEDSGGWIIPKIARKGDLTLFAGEAKKAGKTTFLLHGLKTAHDGGHFLEEPTEKTASLVLTEQGGNILEAAQKAKIADEDRITFVP